MRVDKLAKWFWVVRFLEQRYAEFPEIDKRWGHSQTIADFLYYLRKDFDMPPKKGTKTNGNANAGTISWINITFTDENIADIEASEVNEVEVFRGLMAVAESGHSFSLKYDKNRDSYSATIYGTATDNALRTVGLSAFATEPLFALFVLCYKYHIVLGGELRSDNAGTSSRRSFG